MIQFVLSFGSWFVFFMMVEKMGERPLAVSNIIRSIYIFLMIPGMALGSVTGTLVSRSLGEGRPENVIPVIFRIVKFCFLSMLVIVFLAILFHETVISVYTNNKELAVATLPSYYIIMGALAVYSVMSIIFSGLLGTANTRTTLLIEAITLAAYLGFTWLIAVYLKYSIEWVWGAEYVYFFLIGLMSLLYLQYGNWRKKVV